MKDQYKKLVLSVVLDLVGMISYFFPIFSEYIDVIWAPLSAYLITNIFKNKISKFTAVVGFIEEALPFTDLFPTFTLTWILSYFFEKRIND